MHTLCLLRMLRKRQIQIAQLFFWNCCSLLLSVENDNGIVEKKTCKNMFYITQKAMDQPKMNIRPKRRLRQTGYSLDGWIQF
jgi:hypothetical protein